MKKYVFPVFAVLLNLILLFFVRNLSIQVSDLQRQVRALESDVDRKISREVNDLRNEMREAEQLHSSYELQPTGLDSAAKCLLADFELQLKQWGEDTAVTLLVDDQAVPLTAGEQGHFAAPLQLPVELSGPLQMNIDITTAGITTRENLGGWGDISMLLPLQMNGFGWGDPVFENGTLTIRNHSASVMNQNSSTVPAQETEFYVYINGERVKTAAAQQMDFDTYEYYVDEVVLEGVKLGDQVCVSFACRDEYGLHYEFELYTWTVADTKDRNSFTASGSSNHMPRLSWD